MLWLIFKVWLQVMLHAMWGLLLAARDEVTLPCRSFPSCALHHSRQGASVGLAELVTLIENALGMESAIGESTNRPHCAHSSRKQWVHWCATAFLVVAIADGLHMYQQAPINDIIRKLDTVKVVMTNKADCHHALLRKNCLFPGMGEADSFLSCAGCFVVAWAMHEDVDPRGVR